DMGAVRDYFRAVSGFSLCQMLSNRSLHLWSPQPSGPWYSPASYNSSAEFVGGGSSANWPSSALVGDTRRFVSFWFASRSLLVPCSVCDCCLLLSFLCLTFCLFAVR